MDETTEENTGGVTDAGAPAAVQTLPLLPLTSGVMLPGMVFTMALETEEARAAVEAAGRPEDRCVLVPHSSTAVTPRWAWWPRSWRPGELPGGQPAMVVRGLERAAWDRRPRHRPGPVGPGRGRAGGPGDGRGHRAGPRVPRRAREHPAVPGRRAAGRTAGDVTEPGQVADMAGYSPDLSLAQKVQVLETLDVEARLRLVLGWARETLADLTLRQRIKTSVEEGMEKTQREFLLRRQLESIRKELGRCSKATRRRDPDDYRSRIADRDLPEAVARRWSGR